MSLTMKQVMQQIRTAKKAKTVADRKAAQASKKLSTLNDYKWKLKRKLERERIAERDRKYAARREAQRKAAEKREKIRAERDAKRQVKQLEKIKSLIGKALQPKSGDACPKKGKAFIGYKGVYVYNDDTETRLRTAVIAIKVPAQAGRVTPYYNSQKRRAEYAEVLGIVRGHLRKGESLRSWHENEFRYEIGSRIVPDSFDPDRMRTCSHGIHFFFSIADAEAFLK